MERQFLLSQHYGFSKFYDTYHFPNDTTGYNISGKSYNSLGMTNLTPVEVFDFNPGDVFHYQDSTFDLISHQFSVTSRIWKILPGKKPGKDDIVTYQIEECLKEKWWDELGGSDTIYSFEHDTIYVSYDLGELTASFSRLPDEFLPFPENEWYRVCSLYSFQLSEMHGREQKSIDSNYYYSDVVAHCWQWNYYGPRFQNFYTNGLGITFYAKLS